jgi:predicted SAM-dependent methyltransferase
VRQNAIPMNPFSSTWSDLLLPGLIRRPIGRWAGELAKALAAGKLKRARRLHLACGTHLIDGWANIDIDGPRGVVKLDLTQALPVRTESIDYVFCEHFIEHVERPDAKHLVCEILRVLRPGGRLRLSTPDLSVLVEHYRAGRLDTWHDVGWAPSSACQLLNEAMHSWGHRFVYDKEELETLLQSAGFTNIRRARHGLSDVPELSGLECRPDHGELIYECLK